ncbi:MAG TPA: hypothetical protein VLR88_05330 [Propionibacteriaceae bacterium]|nr:hypothetical protein [Propionibacteriaceae bacterium]
MRGFDEASGVLSIDVVYFLIGEEAIAYLADRPSLWKYLDCEAGPYDGGSTSGCSIPNDYWVANENPLVRSLPLAPDALIKLIPWPRCCEPMATDRAALAERAASEQPLLISFDVNESGQIAAMTEVYTP